MRGRSLRLAASVDDPDRPDPSGLRDPDDEYLVALARDAGVETIVSLDRDLLEASLPDLTMVSPADFLRRLDTGSPGLS